MTHLAFSTCLLLLLSLFLIEVWESRILRRGVDEPVAKQVLALWPLQVVLHLAVFYLVATTPLTSALDLEQSQIDLLYEEMLSETPEPLLLEPSIPPGFEQDVHEQYI
jgi:hypothetical protein